MSESRESSMGILSVIKGVLFGVIATMLFVVIMALVIKITSIGFSGTVIINQIIKVLSIFIGVFTSTRLEKNKGMIKGGLVGLLVTIITYLVFSIIDKQFIFDSSTLINVLLGVVIGCICGVICVNIGK